MPYTLVHDGLTREFDFFAPTGWQYWVARAWLEKGRVGLPLVVALHGAGQDPLALQREWFFPYVWTLDREGKPQEAQPAEALLGEYKRHISNQFFVLYPYGFGWNSRTLNSFAYAPVGTTLINLGVEPQALEERTLRGWNSGVNGVTTGPGIDDVGFIKEMMRVIDQKLRRELESMAETIDELTEGSFPWVTPPVVPVGVEPQASAPSLFDKDRRFLFGYSNGGMMAHRLVRQMPDYWAAVWGLSTTVGGKPQRGFGLQDNSDAIVNLPDPERGAYSVSFFALHGEKDEIAPPGVDGEVFWTPDFTLQSPVVGSLPHTQYLYAGFTAMIESDGTVTFDIGLSDIIPGSKLITGLTFLPGFLPLAQGWRGYIDYNGLAEGSVRRPRPGLGDFVLSPELPDGPSDSGTLVPGVPLVSPPSVSLPPTPVRTAYEYASDDASTEIEGIYPYAANPICVMYIDPNMTHGNFMSDPARYFFAFDVWRFFRTHPRVLLSIDAIVGGSLPIGESEP